MRCCPEPRRVAAVDCCPRRLSLCRMQPPEARFGPPVQPTSSCAPELAQGAWLRRGPRRLSRAQSCFPAKENPSGVGFGRRRPPAKQQGPGSQGQPRPAVPSGEQRAGGESTLRCFPEPRRVGAVVAARRDFPFAECSCQKLVLGRRCDWTSALCRRAGSRGMAGNCAHEAIVPLILLPNEGEPVGSECLPPETPSKAAGSREPGSAQPCFALWRAWGRGRKRLALLSGSEAHWGCGLLPEECFPLQNAVPRSSFWAFGATGSRRCAAELAQGAWLGTVRMRPSSP